MYNKPSEATLRFISDHRTENVKELALKHAKNPDIDLLFALQQIDGWQRAKEKLPLWSENHDIIYPKHISMEQCSSEKTAKYKREIVNAEQEERSFVSESPTSANQSPASCSRKILDLTGGFGVDLSYMSTVFSRAVYVEQQEYLCEVAKHNFKVLGLEHIEIVNSTAEEFLENSKERFDVIYLDPARRDSNGKKTYAIADCTPDVVKLMPLLKAHGDRIIVKLSPMFDHHEFKKYFEGISRIHILSVKNECKETLLEIDDRNPVGRVICVNDNEVFETSMESETSLPVYRMPEVGEKLFVPNASIMKAGCFAELCKAFSLVPIGKNSHLFLSAQQSQNVGKPVSSTQSLRGNSSDTASCLPSDNSSQITSPFPGRVFRIKAVCSLNRKELKETFNDVRQANIAVRNFPLSADEVRKRLRAVLGLRDGGETYIFCTTSVKNNILLRTEKD